MHALFVGIFAVPLVVAVTTTSSSAAPQHDADARLAALYTSEWKWREQQLPDSEDSERPIHDHLAKVDAAAQEMRLRYWEEVQKKLEAINRAELSAQQQVNYDVY